MTVGTISTSARCEELIQSTTIEEQAQLSHFAQRRLAHFGLNTDLEHDLFQQAIYAVIRGISGDDGRKPNDHDVASRDNFQNYLRGVISSIAEGWARTEHRNTHCSLDLFQEILADPHSDSIEFRDLRAKFFQHLRQRAAARLLPTINAWEKAPDERIPCVVSRKHVCAVRKLAQQVAVDIGLKPAEKNDYSSVATEESDVAFAESAGG